jgi:hypothetical protein
MCDIAKEIENDDIQFIKKIEGERLEENREYRSKGYI